MTQTRENWLARVGLRLSAWFERWFPDAFALALLVVVIVFLASLTIGASPMQAADWFGVGFWDLVPFTMQMAMILVTGYVAATSPPIHRAIQAMASWPRTQRSAIHPFWMLPLLGILGIKARDILGYCALQVAVHVPVVLLLVWALNYTLQ